MKVLDVFDFIEKLAPFQLALERDNCGLLLGSKEKSVSRAVVSLDFSKAAVDFACGCGAELLVTHHPAIFNPLKSVCENSAVANAIKAGLSVISAHTNLDAAERGINAHICELLSLKNAKVLKPESVLDGKEHGLSWIGELENPLNSSEFLLLVKKAFGKNFLLHNVIEMKIKRVAVASGNGSDALPFAIDAGADAFVTGEVRHNRFVEAADNEILLVDAGHYATEQAYIPHLAQLLMERFHGLVVFVHDPENLVACD